MGKQTRLISDLKEAFKTELIYKRAVELESRPLEPHYGDEYYDGSLGIYLNKKVKEAHDQYLKILEEVQSLDPTFKAMRLIKFRNAVRDES